MPFEKKYLIGITVVSVILIIAMTIMGVFIGINIASKDDTSFVEVNPNINIQGSTELGVGVQDVTSMVEDCVVQITSEEPGPYGTVRISRGSGVILSSNGYIITNAHVIGGAMSAQNVTITLSDGREFVADDFKQDTIADIAYVKIDSGDLPHAVIGDSSKLRKGQQVVVIGNPLGTLGGSVTDGVLSALDRNIIIDNKPMRLLQTNAEINPGNSGGGMFDMTGRLIGIVNAKSTATEVEGIGFAIPINDAMKVVDDLKRYGFVKGRIDTGIMAVELLNIGDMIRYFGRIVADGEMPAVYVYDVNPKLEGKVASGDKIVAIQGKSIHSLQDYNLELCKYKLGNKVEFEFYGVNGLYTLDIVLDEYNGK